MYQDNITPVDLSEQIMPRFDMLLTQGHLIFLIGYCLKDQSLISFSRVLPVLARQHFCKSLFADLPTFLLTINRDVLATRDTVGIASGYALVDGHARDISFQRKTGYAQQKDVHLETMTVREALRFNALMCQPRDIPKKEKLAYVETVIKLLGMGYYADAIVGVPGEGKRTN